MYRKYIRSYGINGTQTIARIKLVISSRARNLNIQDTSKGNRLLPPSSNHSPKGRKMLIELAIPTPSPLWRDGWGEGSEWLLPKRVRFLGVKLLEMTTLPSRLSHKSEPLLKTVSPQLTLTIGKN